MTIQECADKTSNFITDLTTIKTKLLVEELLKREGVYHKVVEPYEPVTAPFINTNDFTSTADSWKTGPCILIKVVD